MLVFVIDKLTICFNINFYIYIIFLNRLIDYINKLSIFIYGFEIVFFVCWQVVVAVFRPNRSVYSFVYFDFFSIAKIPVSSHGPEDPKISGVLIILLRFRVA